jgi:WD40 repeat protein
MNSRTFLVAVLAPVLVLAGCSRPPQAIVTPEKPVEPAKAEKIGKPLPWKDYFNHARFASDGQSVVTLSQFHGENNVEYPQIWSTATGDPVGEPINAGKRVYHVIFSPDAATFLTLYPARLWDMRTGKLILEDNKETLNLPESFSPDGKSVLIANGKTARLWNTRTGQPMGQPLEHDGEVGYAAFSPDAKLVVTSSEKKAHLWHAASGIQFGKPLEHRLFAKHAVISHDGQLALTACGSNGTSYSEVQLWDISSSEKIGLPVFKGELYHGRSFVFAPDGKTFFIEPADTAPQLFDTATQKPIELSPQADRRALRYSPDGKFLVAVGEKITAWDLATGKATDKPLNPLFLRYGFTAQWEIAPSKPFPLGDITDPFRVAISANGAVAVNINSEAKEGRPRGVQVWNTATWEPLCPPIDFRDSVVAVRLSPDGRTLLTVEGTGTPGGHIRMGIKDRAQLWRLPAVGK